MSAPSNPYEEIDSLVLKYQASLVAKDRNCQEVTLKLIEIFMPLFNKYLKMIKEGVINFQDYDSRCFVGLFISDPRIRKNLKKRYQSRQTRSEAYRALGTISYFFSQVDEEDLIHEFIVILLKLALRYEVRKGFCAYLIGYFRYEVARMITKTTSNPLTGAVELDDSLLNIAEQDFDSYLETNDLDTSWIYGSTCTEAFVDLTPLERMIIKLFYIEKITDIKIAEMTGYHRNWIGIRRRNAVKQIESKLKEFNMLNK